MWCTMTPVGIIEAVLSPRERDAWQTNLTEIQRDVITATIKEAQTQGLTGEIHLLFQNGARVCTIRLVSRCLLHGDGVTSLPPA